MCAGHQAECAREAAALRELAFQFRWSGFAIRLVLGIDLGAKRGRQAFIEQDRDAFGPDLLHEVAEKPAEAVQRINGIAGVVDHVVGQRIVGPEYIDTGIDEVLHLACEFT